MSDEDKFKIIRLLQGRVQNMGSNITTKQQRIDELIRDNTRFKLRNGNKKCPFCNDGEKIPEKVEIRMKKQKEAQEKKEKFRKL